MLFAYRSGKNRITPKVWLKLERAEREAGSAVAESGGNASFAESKGKVKESPWDIADKFVSMVREDETPYSFTPKTPPTMPDPPPDDGIKPLLERIAKALEKLVEMETEKRRKDDRG